MKIMVTSFKRSHACTAAISAPDCVPGHRCTNPCLLWRLLDAHQQVWVCLSLVGSLLLSPGSWCTQEVLFVPSKSLFPQSCVSSSSCLRLLWCALTRGSNLGPLHWGSLNHWTTRKVLTIFLLMSMGSVVMSLVSFR